MARVGTRLAGLTREQLEEFAVQAVTELPRGSKAASWLNATLAVTSPVPAWAVSDVLLNEDLCAAIVSHLELCDHAAASVCRHWLWEWRAMLVHRRVLSTITEMPLQCKPAHLLKLSDRLIVSAPEEKCLMAYLEPFDVLRAREVFRAHEPSSWLYETVLGADGRVFCFDLQALKLRRLRQSPCNGVLEEEATVDVRKLTDEEEDVLDDLNIQHRYLDVCEDVLYLIRPPIVEAFDVASLAPLAQHGFILDIAHASQLLPFEAFDRSQLLSYIAIETQLLALNRSGQLVKLDLPCRPQNPFAFDVCDDRLYVLNTSYDEENNSDNLELLSLTLEGHPTQRPLKLAKIEDDDDVTGDYGLSASPEGIYVANYSCCQVRKVGFAGQEYRGHGHR